MLVALVVSMLTTSATESAPECVNPTVQAVSEMPLAERRAITACAQRLAAAAINARQATRHDPMVTMKADVVGATLRYNYQLALDAKQISASRLVEAERMIRTDQCADAGARLVLENGGAYRFVWTDRHGQTIRDVLIDHC